MNFSSFILKSFQELKNRIIFLLFFIFILRIGTYIPIPGINLYILNNLFKQNNNIVNILNLFSGGSLVYASILTLGVMPYISSSIIIQLLTFIFPYFMELKKEGIIGEYKLNRYMKYLTLIISIIQSIVIFVTLSNISNYKNIFIKENLNFYLIAIITLITGTIFLMWLGEQITEKGLGNGTSVIMFVGIISNLINYLLSLFKSFFSTDFNYFKILLISFIFFFTIYFIVYVEMAQKKILIQYPSKNYRNIDFLFSSYDTYLPFKINMSGVMPSIFSSSIMLIPSILLNWINNYLNYNFLSYIIILFYPKNFLYLLFYIFWIVFFNFFYTLLIYNSNDISNNLKKSGAYIPGIRPGFNTSIYLNKVILRLTLFSSLYMLIICFIPDLIYDILNIKFYFSGTSLLIVVIVIMEFISQIKSLIISNNYSFIFKKYF